MPFSRVPRWVFRKLVVLRIPCSSLDCIHSGAPNRQSLYNLHQPYVPQRLSFFRRPVAFYLIFDTNGEHS